MFKELHFLFGHSVRKPEINVAEAALSGLAGRELSATEMGAVSGGTSATQLPPTGDPQPYVWTSSD